MFKWFLNAFIWIVESLLKGLVAIIVGAINFIIASLGIAINFILSFLPDSPFKLFNLNIDGVQFLGYLDWIVPISYIVTLIGTWCACMIAYYGIRAIMKFTKLN
ncbi:hypothetical protein VN21_00355 [Paraclostridium benzoelyticum]|uniref:Uncharacterized protein n=1 Tax=Paraclostridium benzoelyticum TaxID=1629550 RepID=A0A0M3DKV2_9FIRM|nr:hypothetical protein [Paraclostridium benzoelyticum]KKY02968.1 hypothetical protein VN21_00355 [Paraclostridium benzoelyticum]